MDVLVKGFEFETELGDLDVVFCDVLNGEFSLSSVAS